MKTLLLLALPLALAACTQAPQDTPDPAAGSPDIAAAADAAPAAGAAEALPRYHWRLVEANDAQGQRIDGLFANPDKPLQLDFADGRVSVGNACNRMGGGFTLDGAQLEVGQMAGTMMACPDEALMTMEREAGQRLAGTHAVAFAEGDAPRLTLTNAGGDVLVFEGAPTPETRFGGPGARVFLEVAPQRVACSHPLIPDHQCLSVRDVTFDDNGVRSEAGEWRLLYDEIEGFTHQPGTRNVLRLDRFERSDVPADASSVVYVLDMVVESELVAE